MKGLHKHLRRALQEGCFHAKGRHRKAKSCPANQLFVPVLSSGMRLPATGWGFWLCVDISPGGQPELIPHKGLFNNNQKLERGRKGHSDPAPSEGGGQHGPRVFTLPARAPGAAWGFFIFVLKIEHDYVSPDYHHQMHQQNIHGCILL